MTQRSDEFFRAADPEGEAELTLEHVGEEVVVGMAQGSHRLRMLLDRRGARRMAQAVLSEVYAPAHPLEPLRHVES